MPADAHSALSPVDRFARAIRERDATTLREVLAHEADARDAINTPMFGFDSPALLAVAGSGNIELIDILLEYGADPNRKSDWWAGGFHPLYAARGAAADRLLAAGAIADACAGARLDRIDLLTRILDDDPARVHERGGDGQMPLHFARSRPVVDLLLDRGADIDARDLDHRATAAEWMIDATTRPEGSRVSLARYLVERGASVDIFLAAALDLTDRARALVQRDPGVLSRRTGHGDYGEQPPSSFHIYFWTIGPHRTPLMTAAAFGARATLDVLLEHASPEQRLLVACHEGRSGDARAILAAHPGIVERLAPEDRGALTAEADTANAPAVELMLALGFDPALSANGSSTGQTALHRAAWKGAVACVAAILHDDAGRALVEVRDEAFGGTPLSWCCHGSRNCRESRADHAAVARLLLEAGAHVGSDFGGCSEAMQAVVDGARRV